MPVSKRPRGPSKQARTPCDCFGAQELRDSWSSIEGGVVNWQGDRMTLSSSGPEWAAAELQTSWPELSDSRNLLLQAYCEGAAELAGLSFGPFRDFLAPLTASPNVIRCLQLELDRDVGLWTFRVDGQLQLRQWWDRDVTGIEDFFTGKLSVKARRPKEVRFHGLSIRAFDSPCRLTVVTTCHRFLQRLRITLRNWCRQNIPAGAIEVIVVNPESPDGLHEHLAAVSAACPHVRLREIPAPASLARNKGAMINRAIQAAQGDWIWLADSDCLFDADAAADVLKWTQSNPPGLLFCERRFLSHESTQGLLAGTLDGLADFRRLSDEPLYSQAEPIGYTQIAPRGELLRLKYREDVNNYSWTDVAFRMKCESQGLRPMRIDGLSCLHLAHPFSWHGAPIFL
jgi:hypothetical protein